MGRAQRSATRRRARQLGRGSGSSQPGTWGSPGGGSGGSGPGKPALGRCCLLRTRALLAETSMPSQINPRRTTRHPSTEHPATSRHCFAYRHSQRPYSTAKHCQVCANSMSNTDAIKQLRGPKWSGPRPGGLTLRLRDSWGTEVRGWSSLAKLSTYRGFRT
jgi:hypothetical protein